MTNDNLYHEIWIEAGDSNHAQYSVYDITRAVNFVLRTINNNLPRSASELKKMATLTVSSGQATLPTDFLALKSVWNGSQKLTQVIGDEEISSGDYDIYGNTLVTTTDVTSINLYYKAQLTQLDASGGSTPTGDFPLADFYIDLVKKYAVLFLNSSTEANQLASQIGADVRYISAGRDKSAIKPRQSFYI